MLKRLLEMLRGGARVPPERYRETLTEIAYGHRKAVSKDDMPYEDFRDSVAHLGNDALHAMKDDLKRQAERRAEGRTTPGVLVDYHGVEYEVVLGPPIMAEQRNGALMSTGMPTINLADPATGALRRGLTVDVPEAPIKPGQVLVGGKEEGLRALTEAGVVRHTGGYYRSARYDAAFAVCDFLGLPSREETSLDALRRETETDTKLAASDEVRLERYRQRKEQGPVRTPDIDIDI